MRKSLAGENQKLTGSHDFRRMAAITLIVFTLSACADSTTQEKLETQAQKIETDLKTQAQRTTDLEILLKDMINEEKDQRISADAAIDSRISLLSADLANFKVSTNSSISLLQTKSEQIQLNLTSVNSDLSKKINDLSAQHTSLSNELNGKVTQLDGSLRELIRSNGEILEKKLYSERDSLLEKLRVYQDSADEKYLELSKKAIQAELGIESLAKSHEEFKAYVTQNFATKAELSSLRELYLRLEDFTKHLNLKIDFTAEQIKERLGDRLDLLSKKIDTLSDRVDRQEKSIDQLRGDLNAAILEYRSEIKDMGFKLGSQIDAAKTQVLHVMREEDAKLREEMFKELDALSLEFTIYTKRAVGQVAKSVQDLEHYVELLEKSNKAEAEKIRTLISDTRAEMAQAIADEQLERQKLAAQVEELANRVRSVELDLVETNNLARINAENIRRLRLDFEDEKVKVSDRFKVERAETDKRFQEFQNQFEEQLQKVIEKTDKLTRELGDEVREQMRKVVSDIAVINTRVSGIDSTLKNLTEEVQLDRAKTFQLQAQLQGPREKLTPELVASIRAIGSVQFEFIRALAPDDERLAFYDELFKPVMRSCGGDTAATTPNALGLDSFQILAMEYTRMLLLGERTGMAEIDQIFHGFGSVDMSDGLQRTIMLGLVRYPKGSETESCLQMIQTWGRNVVLKDERFRDFRLAIATNEQLGRQIEGLYGALSRIPTPAMEIDQIVAKAIEGLRDRFEIMKNIRSAFALELLDHAFATLALSDRTFALDEFARFREETAADREEELGQIASLRSDLKAFEARVDQRIGKLEAEVGTFKTSLKRALDVLISMADRAGWDDLKAYVRLAAKPIDYTPVIVPNWNPRVSQVQHFFSGPLSLKNKTDACTGAKIMETGAGSQDLLRNGQWGVCWVNFRGIPQKQWGNEASTIWFRVFGSATAINIRVDPAKQLVAKHLFTQYNFNRTFNFVGISPNDPNLKLYGTFDRGVFDIRSPDILDYYIRNIRTWSGVVLTFTALRVQEIGGETITRVSSSVDYRIQLYSPLVIDFKSRGVPYTIARTKSAARFDLQGNGEKVKTGWVAGDEAGLLGLDLDGSGCIESGRELFGEATLLRKADGSAARAKNGFEALAQYDDNKDGVIDAKDSVFEKLLVWRDRSGLAACSSQDLVPLRESGVSAISLEYKPVAAEKRWQEGNDLRYVSKGSHRVYDIFFGFTTDENPASGNQRK
jgi:hypothetical protein